MIDTLNELTNELIHLKWSKARNKKYGRKLLSVADGEEEPDRFYFICGLVRDWSMRPHNNYKQSLVVSKPTHNKKHKKAIELATKYIELLDPNFTYTSIQFSKCMLTPRHVDKNNVGLSTIVGLGSYEGGSLIIYDEEGNEHTHDIFHKPLVFNANQQYHRTQDFTGTRFTITFYNVKDFK